MMKGYDEYNTILLPPRAPSDKLPFELTEYYDGMMCYLKPPPPPPPPKPCCLYVDEAVGTHCKHSRIAVY